MEPSRPNVGFTLPLYHAIDALLSPSEVKTGRWAGVVTAFITMSDIKDEIDWEFPGTKTTEGQSNYFWQGVIRRSLFYTNTGCSSCIHSLYNRRRDTR